jgi:hypothetical protein
MTVRALLHALFGTDAMAAPPDLQESAMWRTAGDPQRQGPHVNIAAGKSTA